MRPSEIKVGELKKSKKFLTHAARSLAHTAFAGSAAGSAAAGQASVSSPVEWGQ